MKAKTAEYLKKNSMAIIKNGLRMPRNFKRSICKSLMQAGEISGWKQYVEAEIMIRETNKMPKQKFIPVLSKKKRHMNKDYEPDLNMLAKLFAGF